MKIRPNAGDLLTQAINTLKAAGITTARLDSMIILEDVLGIDRANLLAHPEMPMTSNHFKKIHEQIEERAQHVPLAYIRGKVMFYGREFKVDSRVLIPRPESEAIIELLKNFAQHIPLQNLSIADIGTGSGCLGITVALELQTSRVDCYDISADALIVAKANAKSHGIRTRLFKEDLLSGANRDHYDVILANLPYVPDDYPVNKAVRFEPHTAVFAGKDGLQYYRQFWGQLTRLAERPVAIITESLPSQHTDIADLANQAGYSLDRTNDFAQLFTGK
jgi:release factor glutamine methyltransferase